MSPEDLQLLADLCNPGKPVDFAARPDLADFLERPEVQAHLAAILTLRDIRYQATLQNATTSAIATLQKVISDTDDLIEQRRAATSILRTVRAANSPRGKQDRPRNAPCHRDRLCDLGAPSHPDQLRDLGAPRTTFRSPAALFTAIPGAPPFEIPSHFKRLNTFVYSEVAARSLNARQVVANALALLQQGDSQSLQALFNHCTYTGRFGTASPEQFEPIARQRYADLLELKAAYAAPLIRTTRQRARQDVIIIQKSGHPAAFTIHLNYPMFGDQEYCWIIDRYSPNPHLTPPESAQPPPATPIPTPSQADSS
jgi:hypothetical protein